MAPATGNAPSTAAPTRSAGTTRRAGAGSSARSRTLDVATTTLNAYVIETWTPTYAPMLAPRTREVYAQTYDRHVAPRSGTSRCTH